MAKYTQQGMFDKLSEFSNSRKNKTTLKKYNGGGPIIWVTDENDPRYKDYLIRQALYNYSNNPNFNLKNLAYYDLVRAIRKNDFKIFNDPSYYNTLLSTNYTNTYDDEFDRVYYEGLKDQNIGSYGSKVNYESILNDQLHSDPDYGDSYFSFKNEELSDPFFKTYPPNSWEKQTRFSSSPYIPNYAWTGSKWTTPNTTFIEDKINRERLKNVYPNLTDAEIDKYISKQREQPNFITNVLNSDGDFIHADIGNWDYANDKFIYLANPNKKTFIDNNRRLGYLQEQIEDDIRQDFDYVPIWSEPEQIVKILPPPIKIERPPLIKIDTNELREPSIPEAPQYTLEPYTDKRLRLVTTPGKTKRKTHRDRLGNGQKYKWHTYHSTKDLEFRKREVVRPMAALVQKLTGYDPKYFEGYYDEEDNYVPGELDYGNLTGAKLEFKGAASLRDFINQQKYKKEYEEYVKKLSEAFDTKNSNSETSSLFKYIKGGTTCPEGFKYINGQCVPIVNDCEDEQCRETDQIQEIYNNALDIPRRVVDYEFGIEDLTNQKYAGNARLAWKSQGVKSFVEPSCMYVAGLGWRCAPATKEYMSHFDPVNFNSNIGFIHAVDRGDLPFTRVGKFSDKNFDDQSKGNMRIGDVVNFKGADNSHAETFVGYKEDGTPMYIDTNGNPSNYSTDSLWTPLRPNTTGKGRDYAYVNRFDTKRYVDDTHGEQIKELEKQARENPTYYEKGGLTKFFSGGPGDKYYKYNNTQYKKDQQGNWYKWNGKNWNLSGSGTYAYDMDNHIGLEDWLQAGRMQADDSNWSNDKPKATVSNYEIKRNKVLNNPFATTQQKIQATNSPLLGNVEIQQNLYKQQAEEAKQKELERQLEFEKQQQEEKQQQHFRTVGADNTLVDNSIVKNNAIYIPNVFEQTESIVKAQKDAARQIAMSGDLAKHFPELYEEYLSEENSNRKGGPLTLEEIALREIRKDGKTFFSTLESRKETAWKKAEQKKYDNLAWYEKGLNAAQAFIADPIMVTSNALFRGEGPMVGQGQWSIDPERFSAEDNYYYDKFSGKSNSTINNMLNIVNVGRAGAGAGMALGEGNFGDATYELATVIPMVKGAKYGWKGLNALMKTQPLKYVPGLASTGWGAMTTGQALTGYGLYHAGAYDFPQAFDAYGKGDYGTGNEKVFMGLINSVPFVAEAKAGMPSVLQDISTAGSKIKQGYNTVAQGESVLPIAWKNPAANLDGAVSETMFNKILQSDDFTPAEKAMLKEYQYSNRPFVVPGPKQDAFNELIGKANLKFPEDAVVTRAFTTPEKELQAFTGTADDIKTISMQDRPSAFSAGVSNKHKYYYGKTDRIVLSGKNLKKVEGNFVKQRYEPLEQGYYANMPDEELTVIDNSKQPGGIGDNFYGTQRLTPEEIRAQAEAVYAEKSANYSDLSSPFAPQPPKDPNFLTGKPKSGNPADGVYSAEESAEVYTEILNDYNEDLRLFADPANKEEAIQKILDGTRQGFADTAGPADELELFGSGFDMKVVGKFPNKTGGYDYVVQPRNIRTLKSKQSTDLNSVSQGNTSSANATANVNAGKQTSSNLEIAQKFDDTENFSRRRITDVEEKRRILRENPDKIVTKYQDVWSNNDELSEVQDLFPFTREGQQQAFDEGTAFSKKWMTQDSQKFDELNSAYKSGNEELMQLDIKRGTLENALNREMNGYIEPEIREKAIAEFLKRNPERQTFDIKNQNGYDPDFIKILIEQNPNDFKFQRIGNIQKQLESVNQRFGELQPEVYSNLKKINENIDPQFRDKVATIYEKSLGPNEMMPNLEVSQAEIHLGNLDEQTKLVQYGKYEPSYLELPQSDKNYLNENLFKTEGTNRAGDSSIEGNILTYGSKPQVLDEQPFFEVISKSGELSSDPEYVRFVGSFMKDPFEVATTNVHEVAGHQGQKMFGNWMGKLQEYDPEMMYDVPMDKNNLAKLFKEALVEPVKGVTLDEAGATQNFRTSQTWLSSPQELYADVMIARYDLAKRLMKNYNMTLEEAILEIKNQVNNPSYYEFIASHPEVKPHFKSTASSDLKNQIIKYLPAVVIGAGYGISQGANSETPKNKYGGNIKTLSKFIRK